MKRFLKITLVVLVILIVAFLMMGLIVPSFEYSATVDVSASPQKCWEVYQDTATMHSWTPGFKSLRRLSGKSGKTKSTYEIVLEQDQTFVMRIRIEDIKAPEFVAYNLENDVMFSDYTYRFEGNQQSTKISSHYKISGKNIFWRSMLFLSRSMLKRGTQEQLEALKKAVEK